MKDLMFPKQQILEALRTNREAHIKEYDSLVRAYREHARVELNNALEKLSDLDKAEPIFISVQVPTSYVKEYDRAIQMLEMATDSHVVLTPREFDQYVNNEWSFKHELVGLRTSYTNAATI